MHILYERNNGEHNGIKTFNSEEHSHTVQLFLLLLAILVIPELIKSWTYLGLVEISLIAVTVYLSFKWYSKEERVSWMQETWFLVKMIFPLLLVGVFFAGIIVELLPSEVVVKLVGGDNVLSYFIASLSAALMYFSTLTEVPIINALTYLGMGRGPAISMLLAGPALSLPSMIVISRIMGVKKGLSYIVLVVIMAMISGIAFDYYVL